MAVSPPAESSSSKPVQPPATSSSISPATPEPTGETAGQKNAIEKAKAYLNVMCFSYQGLVSQLEFEGFTHEEAVYGVDRCGADWNQQALGKANSYLSVSAFSRQGLVDQLILINSHQIRRLLVSVSAVLTGTIRLQKRLLSIWSLWLFLGNSLLLNWNLTNLLTNKRFMELNPMDYSF